MEAVPTFRVMNQDGVVINKEKGVDTTDEEAVTLYAQMVLCEFPPRRTIPL
jgi:2-oxoisovalerate dehydrogenase E1 component alpha subunit